ncbi:hypothetical protein BMETH_4921601844, partial [methanotrophic bacterial endosymbiont of Bathymodiolus sp.]
MRKLIILAKLAEQGNANRFK